MHKTQRIKKVRAGHRKRQSFFNFKRNKFTMLARDYHNELRHLTIDLMRINRKAQESAALCQQQIDFLKKQSDHLISPDRPPCFEDALYHLENFTFRVTGYRDKMVQFINQALRIGFDERTMGVLSTIVGNRTVRQSHLDTELKKFDKDKDFKDTLSERILLTHRRYYRVETGYSRLMLPMSETKNEKEKLGLWKQNIRTKINRANRIVMKVRDMNDRVMQKINNYIKKQPIR